MKANKDSDRAGKRNGRKPNEISGQGDEIERGQKGDKMEEGGKEKEIEVLPEKWLAAFRNPASTKRPEGSTLVRQFFAPGYYEAYDLVLTYAEKMNLEVLWFLEKRKCGPYINRNFPNLESKCIYCNKKFGHEAIPCVNKDCAMQFCSKECMFEHVRLRHGGY